MNKYEGGSGQLLSKVLYFQHSLKNQKTYNF